MANDNEMYTRDFAVGTTESLPQSSYGTYTGNVLWQWNATDTSQFGSTYILNSTRTAALNITSATISATPGAGGVGARLRFSFSMVAGTGGAFIWPIYSSTGVNLTVPQRFRVNYRIAMANNMKVGFAVHDNANFAFGAAQLPATNVAETNWARTGIAAGETPWESVGGTPINARSPNNSAGNPAVGTYYEDYIMWDAATASTPPYPLYGHSPIYGQGTGQNTVNVAVPTDLTGNPPNAAWNGQTGLQYLGILFITNRGTGTSATVEIADFAVLKHPLDQR